MNLRFDDFRLVNPEDWETLTEVQQQQLQQVAVNFFGEGKGITEMFEETYEGNIECWHVFDEATPETPLYDVWIANVDTGAVFFHNTAKNTGVGMIQMYFDFINEHAPALQPLIEGLTKAYKNRKQPAEYLPENSPMRAYRDAIQQAKLSEE